MKVQQPSHSKVEALCKEIYAFERNLPFYIRCRPARTALIDLTRKSEDTVSETPEVRKKDFKLTFQQHMLALNISEAVIFLQRPYFTRAICQSSSDSLLSKYSSSLIAVFERCLATIAITRSLYSLYPAVAVRHWNFWYHMFTATVCLSSLISMAPSCILSPFAMGELESVVSLLASTPPGSRPRSNLAAVVRMVRMAEGRLTGKDPAAASMGSQMAEMFGHDIPSVSSSDGPVEEEEQQLAMIGWKTRLVRRLKSGFHERGVSIPNIQGHPVQISPRDALQEGPWNHVEMDTSRNVEEAQPWMGSSFSDPVAQQGASSDIQASMSGLFDLDAFSDFPSVSFPTSSTQVQQQPLDLEILAGWGVPSGWFHSG